MAMAISLTALADVHAAAHPHLRIDSNDGNTWRSLDGKGDAVCAVRMVAGGHPASAAVLGDVSGETLDG